MFKSTFFDLEMAFDTELNKENLEISGDIAGIVIDYGPGSTVTFIAKGPVVRNHDLSFFWLILQDVLQSFELYENVVFNQAALKKNCYGGGGLKNPIKRITLSI